MNKTVKNKTLTLVRIIGDLPTYKHDVTVTTQVETIVASLKKNPELPGVVLRENGSFIGTLSRLKIFEWLGRPYGVELFFKKPVNSLFANLNLPNMIYPREMAISEAVQIALNRAPEIRYEPLVVSFGENDLRLLDMNILLMAQSEQLKTANRVIEKQVEIGKVLSSSLELPKVLTLVLEQMETIIPYHRAAILLYRDGGLEFAASHGYPRNVDMEEARSLVNNNSVYSDLIQEQKPISIVDVSLRSDWPHIPGTPPTRSWLGVPIIHNDNILGILSISRLEIAPFTSNEVDESFIFAGQAAVALANAHLFEKIHQVNQQLSTQHSALQQAVDELNQANLTLTRRAIQLETSNQIGHQMTSILDVQELLPKVLNIIQTQFGYSWVGVWMVDQAQTTLTLEACTSSLSKSGIGLPISHQGLVGQAYRSAEKTYNNRIELNGAFTSTPGLSNAFSEIALPLKFLREVMGVLDIQSERLQAFSPDDIAVLQATASQLAMAIRNARTYSELTRLSKSLQPAGPAAITSLTL
jgi:transcriptional regulator with GAF, ATPase, and Fis domain